MSNSLIGTTHSFIIARSSANGHLKFLKSYVWLTCNNNHEYINCMIELIFENAFKKRRSIVIEWLQNKYTAYNWELLIQSKLYYVCRYNEPEQAKYLIELFPNINLQKEFERIFANTSTNLNTILNLTNLDTMVNFTTFYPDIEITNELFCKACLYKDVEIPKLFLRLNPNIDIEYDNHRAFRNAFSPQRKSTAIWLGLLKPDLYSMLAVVLSASNDDEEIKLQCDDPCCLDFRSVWKTKNKHCPYCRQIMTQFTNII